MKRVHLRGAARHDWSDHEEGGRGEAALAGERADQGEEELPQEEGRHAQEQDGLHREEKCSGKVRFTQPLTTISGGLTNLGSTLYRTLHFTTAEVSEVVTAPVTIVLPDGEVYGTSGTTEKDNAQTFVRDTPKPSKLLSVEVPELEGLWSYSSDDEEVASPNRLQALFPVIPISALICHRFENSPENSFL